MACPAGRKATTKLAVDEFAIRKGHHSVRLWSSILESGAILHAHEGKDATALIPLLEKLKRTALKAVAILPL